MSYYVRPMRKEDIHQVNAIDREAFPTQWPPPNYRRELENPLARNIIVCNTEKVPEVKTSQHKDTSSLLSRIKRMLNADRFSGGKPPSPAEYVFGFACIWVLSNEAHITNIAVRSIHQRQGIGELLLIAIMNLTAQLDASIVTLECRVSNTPAQNLYYKYGFKQVGVRRSYYTDNREDALLMSTDNVTSASFQARFQQLKQAYSRRYGITSPNFSIRDA